MNKRKLIEKEAKRDYGKILAFTKVSIAKNHHEAEDLVSEAYFKFFDSLDRGKNKYEPKTNFVNYLMFIVKNIAIDKSRKKLRSPQIIPLYRKEDGKEIINFDEYKSKKIEEIEENDRQADFNKILQIMQKVLKPIDREIISLVYLGYKYDEIAKKLKMNIGTIASRINRNYGKIREELFKKNVQNNRKK